MEDRKVKIALTQGDFNGIGYELIIKALANQEIVELCTPIIYGQAGVLKHYAELLELPLNIYVVKSAAEAKEGKINLVNVDNGEPKVETGKRTEESKAWALKAHDRAKKDMAARLFDAMVTAPAEGLPRQNPQQVTIFANSDIRLVQAEGGQITEQMVQTLYTTLKRDFAVSMPRIAVVDYSKEPTPLDETISETVFGPYEAKKFYEEGQQVFFDAVIERGGKRAISNDMVKVTAGLPIVHTTSIYDEQYSIAGENKADETSMRNAIYAAVDIARRRVRYDEPLKNPLPKLYHEKREDGEKVRFNIPKKAEQQEKE